ncbi:MAG: ATP-binding domain-containing protein [Bacteroidota bacterium]
MTTSSCTLLPSPTTYGIDKDYLRWLYTAVTRSQSKLYLIGFKDDFFVE